MNTDKFEDSLNILAKPGEQLAFQVAHHSRDLATVSCWPFTKFPTAEVGGLIAEIRAFCATRLSAGGDFRYDRQDQDLQALMTKLAHAELPADHYWRECMATPIPGKYKTVKPEQRKHFDFWTQQGHRVEVKTDYITFGSRWVIDGTPTPTDNMAFEYRHGWETSGLYREHDYFCTVTPNIHGDPIWVSFYGTQQLRKLERQWRTWTTKDMGNEKAALATRMYVPHYLLNLQPMPEVF